MSIPTRIRTASLVGVALLVTAGFLPAGATDFDPGDPNDPTDCGTRAVVDQAYVSHFTGDLDLCVVGDIVIFAPDGLVADTLRIDAPVDFTFTESQYGLSNQFLPLPDEPLMAAFLGDVVIHWGTFRGDVRLVSTGSVTVLIPEPGTAALLGAGLLAIAHRRRRSWRGALASAGRVAPGLSSVSREGMPYPPAVMDDDRVRGSRA